MVGLFEAEEEYEKLVGEKRQREMAEESKPHYTRNRGPRKDYKSSYWWKDYVLDEGCVYRNPNDRNGKTFRQRFCVDRSHYLEILQLLRREKVWSESKDACGEEGVPMELLLLGSLRILARNWTFDDLREATLVSERTQKSFFENFVNWYAETQFPIYVKLPTVEEVEANGREYTLAGIPGTIGSIDVVHIRQWAIAANLKQFATGKEKYPSRAYEVMVNHRKLILAVSVGFYGSIVDKTIVKFDEAMKAIRDGRYKDYTFQYYCSDGSTKTMRDVHTINDNGYLKWCCRVEPSKHPVDVKDSNWPLTPHQSQRLLVLSASKICSLKCLHFWRSILEFLF